MDKEFFKELLLFEAKGGVDFKILEIYDAENLYELKLLVEEDVFEEIIIKSDLAFIAKRWLFEKGFQVNTKFIKEERLKIQVSAIDEDGNEIVKITSIEREEDVILKLAEHIFQLKNYIDIEGSKNGD